MTAPADFCVMILSHGRADSMRTVKTLAAEGYTGPWFILIDDEDQTADKYRRKFGSEHVVSFSKAAVESSFDIGDSLKDRRAVVYARNAVFDVVQRLGYTYFLVLDDDYTTFRYRFMNEQYMTKGSARQLDVYFDIMLRFYISTPFLSIAFAQGGDFIGGDSCGLISNYQRVCRKCMNTFFCSTQRRFQFMGRINEDVNAYTHLGSQGGLFLTLPFLGVEQVQTQKTDRGLTDIYKALGTYVKSFYSILWQPSSVKIAAMGFKELRLHHTVDWQRTTPKIISEQHRRKDARP